MSDVAQATGQRVMLCEATESAERVQVWGAGLDAEAAE